MIKSKGYSITCHQLTLVFILMVLIPRLSIDLFLPGLPEAAQNLNASLNYAQLTMTVFMLGYAISMLISGPLSDRYGGVVAAYIGLGLFSIASLICLLATNMTVLIIGRFLQALGGCCGTVIARATIRTTFSQDRQIYFLALLSTAMAVSPLAAPIVGSSVVTYLSWRWVFVLLLGVGLLVVFLLKNMSVQPTTTPSQSLITTYKMLLMDKHFIGCSLTIGWAWFSYFLFSVESPLLIQHILHFSVMLYGLLFALAVSGYVIGARITRYYANQVGWGTLTLIACLLSILGALLMLVLLSVLALSWYSLIVPMMIIMLGVGIIIPCTQGLVLQPYYQVVGTVSGLFFFIQMSFGFFAGLVAPLLNKQPPIDLAIILLTASVLMLVSFYYLVYAKSRELVDK